MSLEYLRYGTILEAQNREIDDRIIRINSDTMPSLAQQQISELLKRKYKNQRALLEKTYRARFMEGMDERIDSMLADIDAAIGEIERAKGKAS